jgi:hypothetical protein
MTMKKVRFNISINAPREQVWKILWEDASYRKWTRVFHEGSYAVTDWKKGSKVLFLSPDGEGMVSVIEEIRPDEYMSIKHLGMVKNGVEDLDSEETFKWSGAHENYTLKGMNGKTELIIDMDTTEDYFEYFSKIWPEALKIIKALSENNS